MSDRVRDRERTAHDEERPPAVCPMKGCGAEMEATRIIEGAYEERYFDALPDGRWVERVTLGREVRDPEVRWRFYCNNDHEWEDDGRGDGEVLVSCHRCQVPLTYEPALTERGVVSNVWNVCPTCGFEQGELDSTEKAFG